MQFVRHFSLTALNTFAVKCTAAQFVVVDDEASLADWCARGNGRNVFLLGGGSNLLLTRDLEIPVLKIALRGMRIVADDGEYVIVEAMAGETWHDFVQWTLAQRLSGLENLSLIPGFVGAAPVQNIGAYGVEIAETCERVDAIDMHSGVTREFSKTDCSFGYRDSVFKRIERDRYAITRVRFRLSRHFQPRLDYGDICQELKNAGIDTPDARAVSNAVSAIRRRKLPDPTQVGNAGSFFKNPIVAPSVAQTLQQQYFKMPHYAAAAGQIKLAAGWLIEQTGWKGRRIGAAGVHDQHALVLVNYGGASGADIWAIAQAVQQAVQERFAITLEPEPRVVV